MRTHKRINEGEKIVVRIDPELTELIPNFLKNRHADIQNMLELLKEENYEAIARIGHGMKGAGAGFGFDVITEIGSRIEKAGNNNDGDEIKKGIDGLSDYMERLEVTYE